MSGAEREEGLCILEPEPTVQVVSTKRWGQAEHRCPSQGTG